MIVVDVNLLLYATVTGFAQHDLARSWWEDVLGGDHPVGLPIPSIFGFIRVSTGRRVLASPLPVASAIAYVDQWLAQPAVEVLGPGPRHVEIACRLLRDQGTAGNLTTDAQIAALAIENDGVVHTNDTDFGRFAGVQRVNPLRPTT